MNTRRVANLLRELADAIEQPEEPKRPRRRPLVKGAATAAATAAASPEMITRINRAMRNRGMTG